MSVRARGGGMNRWGLGMKMIPARFRSIVTTSLVFVVTPIAMIAAISLATGCAHHAGAPGAAPNASSSSASYAARAPEPDSVTTGLWRLDETAGTLAADSGPFRLDGVAGFDTRTGFGRFGRARSFTHSIDSFVQVPYNPEMEAGGGLTIEAWIYLASYGSYEDTPIAARWTVLGDGRSWLFSVTGLRLRPPVVANASPGDHFDLVTQASTGRLLFAFMPGEAGVPRAYTSTRAIELNRWTHVAATYDGAVVRLWIDGELDAQFASIGRIRSTHAPLQIGNTIDPRWLSTFAGDLRADQAPDRSAFYAFEGLIDEVRLSSAARTSFEGYPGR